MNKPLFQLSTCLLLVLHSFAAALERPLIDEVTPKSFVQHVDTFGDETNVLTVKGRYLWPEDEEAYPYHKLRVMVLMRSTSGYEPLGTPIRGKEGNLQTLTVNFSSRKWLKEGPSLDVQVKIEDMGSLPYRLSIVPPPSGPAKITSVSPEEFIVKDELPVGTRAEDHYRFKLRGSNFDTPKRLVLRIDGSTVRPEALEVKEGYLEAVVPKRLWSEPGTYRVSLRNRKGAARSAWIALRSPREEEEARRAAEEAATVKPEEPAAVPPPIAPAAPEGEERDTEGAEKEGAEEPVPPPKYPVSRYQMKTFKQVEQEKSTPLEQLPPSGYPSQQFQTPTFKELEDE